MYLSFIAVFFLGTALNFIFFWSPVLRVCAGLIDLIGLTYVAYCFLRFQALLSGWPIASLTLFVMIILPILIPFRLIFSAIKAYRMFKDYGLKTDWLGLSASELKRLKS